MKASIIKQTGMFITAITLCFLFGYSIDSFSSTQLGTNTHLTQHANSLQASESFATVFVISTATKFEHQNQLAKWLFVDTWQDQLSMLNTDAYLMTEPIIEPWFLFPSISRFRLSGWKDASLQYKIKNALI